MSTTPMLKKVRALLYFVLLFAACAAAAYYTFPRDADFSFFAAALIKASAGMLLFYLFVKYVIGKWINVREQLLHGNTAFGLYLLSFALILAVCIATA